jgi:hypothetical protein
VPHAVCTIFILARAFSRLFFLRKWFIDDSLIVFAWLASTAVCVLYVFATETPDISDAVVLSSSPEAADELGMVATDNVRSYVLFTYLGLIFYQFCLLLTKLSILAFYVRMFHSRPTERRLAWGTVVFVLLYGIPLLLMSGFQCHPLVSQYSIPGLKCFDFFPLLVSSAVLHNVTDAWLIILVIPCIARLDLPRRQKIALGLVLSLSVFVIAAAMVRLELILHANYRPTGDGVQVGSTLMFFIMTILETDIALICASAPTLRPLIARLVPKWESRSSRRASGPSGGPEVSSNNLTAVSFHGYPWLQTPQQSQNNLVGQVQMGGGKIATPEELEKQEYILPDSPIPISMPRRPAPTAPIAGSSRRPPPTSSGLRHIITNFATRPWSRAGSLRQQSRLSTRASRYSTQQTNRSANRSASDKTDTGSLMSKPSLLGFERYFKTEEARKSQVARGPEDSPYTGSNESQESFVMGMGDPARPSRTTFGPVSPVSPMSPTSAITGTTVVVDPGMSRAVTDLERAVDEAGRI